MTLVFLRLSMSKLRGPPNLLQKIHGDPHPLSPKNVFTPYSCPLFQPMTATDIKIHAHKLSGKLASCPTRLCDRRRYYLSVKATLCPNCREDSAKSNTPFISRTGCLYTLGLAWYILQSNVPSKSG
jgi:hypothetical protein